MNRYTIIAVAAVYSVLAGLAGAQANELGKQKPIEVIVQLSNQGGDMAIMPSELTLQKGKLYTLVVNNPSNKTHYLSVPQFGAAVQTRKIDVQGGEVKHTGFLNTPRAIQVRSPRAIQAPSAVRHLYKVKEIEVRPGGKAEWTFKTVETGSYDLECGIPAHTKAGMKGKILVN